MVLAQAGDRARIPFSTHDQTTTSTANRSEAWADVKTPGDGFTYAVGNIVVEQTSGATFSNATVGVAPSPAPGINTTLANASQVVILQRSDATGMPQSQRFFYGRSTLAGVQFTRGTNVRAVSAWGASSLSDTRVAICGETYDEELGGSQLTSPLSPSTTNPSGYIAVFDGNWNLIWSHVFHGAASTSSCAITDVSIRVENRSGTQKEVVTYCGISSHGHPGSGTPLSPQLAFSAPSGSGCFTPAAGNASNGSGQWDGIVGRLSRPQSGGSPTTTQEFHSIVGGVQQDGLFGLAEIDTNRFAVVGSTAFVTGSTGGTAYPFTTGSSICWSTISGYVVGTLMVFDASATLTSGNLQLETSEPLGALSSAATIARDVAVVGGFANGQAVIHLVGSTDDSALVSSLATGLGFQTSIGGGTDGYIATVADAPNASVFSYIGASFFGGSGDDGLVGVATWNEFPDHAAIVGFRDAGSGNVDIATGSIFYDTTGGNTGIRLERWVDVAGSSVDLPAVMGTQQALTTAQAWTLSGLGDPAGGGVCMSERGRVNVVGATVSTNYPFVGTNARAFMSGQDGVRTELDMLPIGIGRTDGTGTDASNNAVAYPPGGSNGGTTPTCGLSPFGVRIGETPPSIRRILLDYQGGAPTQGDQPVVLIDRPHPDSITIGGTQFVGAVLDFGFLSSPNVVNQMEIWVNQSTASSFLLPWTSAGTLAFQLGSFPASPTQITVQVICLLNNAVCGGLVSVASPALLIDY